MVPAALTSARVAHPQRRNRLLTITLAAALIAVGAVASTGLDHTDQPTGGGAWRSEPIQFDDPAVVKGARGGKKDTVMFPYFGDPIVRKGASATQR
jgi:hypothetical protein